MNEVKKKLSKLEVNIGFRKTKTIYEIYISGNRQVIKVLDWLYFDNKTSMCRKEEKYKDLVYWDLNKSKKVKYE
jgi:hypothetical protein